MALSLGPKVVGSNLGQALMDFANTKILITGNLLVLRTLNSKICLKMYSYGMCVKETFVSFLFFPFETNRIKVKKDIGQTPKLSICRVGRTIKLQGL